MILYAISLLSKKDIFLLKAYSELYNDLLLSIYEYRLLKGKIKEIPNRVYIFKMVSIAAISVTFIITLCFLAPMYGLYGMYNNVNLFYHFIIPVIAFINYFIYEKHENRYKYALYGVIPLFLYSIYYIANVLIHLDEGISFKYDFYGFLQGNINNIYFVIPVIYLLGYLLSLLTIFLNKKFAK